MHTFESVNRRGYRLPGVITANLNMNYLKSSTNAASPVCHSHHLAIFSLIWKVIHLSVSVDENISSGM
jgi:hypothetical protein